MRTQVATPETLNSDSLEESRDEAFIIMQLQVILLKLSLITEQCFLPG